MESQITNSSNKLKIVQDDLEVEFELEFVENNLSSKLKNHIYLDKEIQYELEDVNYKLEINEQKIDKIDKEIERLTNTADGLDYTISVVSGILAGLIDSFWVGKFSLEHGKEWSEEKTNKFVNKIAKWQGYNGNDLEGSIRHLENKFPLASDSNTPEFGGGLQHHLRDFSHHPSIFGLMFSLVTQFAGTVVGTDTYGKFLIEEVKDKTLIGENLPQKIVYGVVFWFFHLVSDVTGSSNTPGAGTGLPGPLLSFAKMLSALPIFNKMKVGDKNLSEWISKLFNGTYFAERDKDGKLIKESIKPFDFRAEIGLAYELGRQAVPVIINECIVRGFYFVRRFTQEIKTKEINNISELSSIDWKKVLPYKNRTIIRMLTISTATFTTIDLADAAIRGAAKSKGNLANFTKEFLLRINYVGLGRITVAVGTDIWMGFKRAKKRNERIIIMNQQLHLMNAKIFYHQANMWKAAKSTSAAIDEIKQMMVETVIIAVESWEENRNSIDNIGDSIEILKEKDEDLFLAIKNELN